MDIFSKIFRSTFGIDGRDNKKPPDGFFFDDHDGNNTVPQPDDLLSYFDQVFANFDKVFGNFGSNFDNLPAIEPETGAEFNSQPGSLRDQMLKEPDSNSQSWRDRTTGQRDENPEAPNFFHRFWSQKPYWNRAIQEKLDTDLDELVKNNGLDAILDSDKSVCPPPARHFSSGFNRFSVNTRRTADGKVEEHRTMTDSEGNETTVVTRSVDGKTFKQTTTKKRNGEVEVTEDWSNVNPEDQANFKQRWNLFSTPRLEAPPAAGLLKEDTDGGKLDSIFEKLFGSKGQK